MQWNRFVWLNCLHFRLGSTFSLTLHKQVFPGQTRIQTEVVCTSDPSNASLFAVSGACPCSIPFGIKTLICLLGQVKEKSMM